MQIKLKGPNGEEIKDQVREPLYDTRIVEEGQKASGTFGFFKNVQNKGLALTNLRQNGVIETGSTFLIQGLSVHASGVKAESLPVLNDVTKNSYFDLILGEKSYLKSPMTLLAGNIGTRNPDFVQLGSHRGGGLKYTGHDAIALKSLQTFEVTMHSSSEVVHAESVNYMVVLHGLKRRPIQ